MSTDQTEKNNRQKKQLTVFIWASLLVSVSSVIFTYYLINLNLVQYHEPVNCFEVMASKKDPGEMALISIAKSLNPAQANTPGMVCTANVISTHNGGNTVVLDDYLFHKNPMFFTWFTLVLFMITIAAISFPAHIFKIIDLNRTHGLSVFPSLALVVSIGSILFLPIMGIKGLNTPAALIDKFGILLSGGWVLLTIVGMTFVLIMPMLVYMFMIGAVARKMHHNSAERGKLEAYSRSLESLNKQLQNTMMVLASVIVFSVLTSSLLRLSIKNEMGFDDKVFDLFPVQVSYVYGLYFTLFLGMMYIPVQLFLKHKASQIKERAYLTQQEDSSNESWTQKIIDRMNFDASMMSNIKIVTFTLSPLIATAIQNQLPSIFG